MKKFIVLLVIIVIIAAIIILVKSGAPQELPEGQVSNIEENVNVNNDINYSEGEVLIESFSFTGYGPGKSHVGTFKNFEIKEGIEGQSLGTIIFKTDSVETDTDAVTAHLCRDDFFDCANNPEIIFTAKNVEKIDDNNANISGTLSFRGSERMLTFPVNIDGQNFSADFRVDVTPFNFSFIGIDDEVRIQFNGKIVERI